MANLNLEIISPSAVIFKGQCHMAVIPCAEGDIGVMQGHENLVANLKAGEITIYDTPNNVKEKIEVTSGFAEINGVDKLLVLLD